jgi:HK97 family phage portal protein
MTWENVVRLMGSDHNSLAGVTVNESTALNYSPIWCGVATLSNDVAKLPLGLYRNLENGGREPFTTHRLHRILHDEPNPEMSSLKFREMMQALCILYGNAYAEIVRDGLGRPVGMYPIVPSRVAPIRDGNGRLAYRVSQPSGGQTIIQAADIIHGSSLTTDGIIGHGLTEHASESIGLGLATEKFGGSFFGNGAVFGGTVEYPMVLTEPQKDNIRTAIEAIHRGVERAHKILVLGGGAKFTERGTKPNDGQYNETRQFQISEVCRWLRMPPHKLGDYEHAHFDNIELANLDYWCGSVAGWLTMWEQEYQRKLVAPLEQSQQSIKFNMEGELRGDSAARAAFYTSMVNLGAFSINDVLKKENMNPIPEGDVHMVPLNMIPLEKYGEWIDAKILAAKAGPTPQMKEPDPQPAIDAARILDAVHETREIAAAHRVEAEQATILAGKSFEEARRLAGEVDIARGAQLKAERAASEEQAQRVAAEHAAAAAADDAASARVELQDATERLEAALSGKASAEQDAAARAQAVEQALADVAVKSAALSQAEATALEQSVLAAAHRAQADEADARVAAIEASLEQAQRAVDAAHAEKAAALSLAAETAARLEARESDERDRMTRTVIAHRALIQDAIQRIARTETERARKRGGNPENLRRWVDAFYDETGRDIGAEMLYPAIVAHLAWKRSDENPREVARAIADDYYSQSERQLRALADGMVGEEFQATLSTTLSRWERERPAAVADKVLRDAIEHLTRD